MSVSQTSSADNVRLGIAVILVTDLGLSLGDAAIKALSADFVLWQIFALRSVFSVPALVAIIVWRTGAASLMPRHLGWAALRSLMLASMWVAYYASLPHLELGVAAAAYNTLPIFITLFAALFIGDRIGPIGWGAIFVGFAGVLLILRPEASGFNAYALLPLAAAVLYALAMILTRTKCRGEHPLVLALSLNVTFVVVGLLATLAIAATGGPVDTGVNNSFLLGAWSSMGETEWISMALLAVAAVIGSVGAAVAYQIAPPATVATFDFSYLGFAALWGVLFFAEILDVVTIIGIVMIVVAGVLAVRR
ncbi:MAG TPA: DMT family transporter [Verrucomicrobiae bacterium]|nr:DMT family transporter [Verrucomicrobiae bacterium]